MTDNKIVKTEGSTDLAKMSRDELEAYVRHLEGLVQQKGDMGAILKMFATAMDSISKSSAKTAKAVDSMSRTNREMADALMASRGGDFHGH